MNPFHSLRLEEQQHLQAEVTQLVTKYNRHMSGTATENDVFIIMPLRKEDRYVLFINRAPSENRESERKKFKQNVRKIYKAISKL